MLELKGTQLALAVLLQLGQGGSLSTAEVISLQHDEAAKAELLSKIPTLDPTGRRAAVSLLVDLGRPVLPAEGVLPERPGPYLTEPRVVALLVPWLSDKDAEVRAAAADALATWVPDLELRVHAREIEAAVAARPTLDSAALLLGRCGTATALALLRQEKALVAANPANATLALAKLGHAPSETEVLGRLDEVEDPRQKRKVLLQLGYVGTPRTLLFLARMLRTPEAYVWMASSQRSMRVHVIEALSFAFPGEKVLWRPFFKPSDDSYYDAVEGWATDTLGVTWSEPRPPFLYENDAPFFPR